MKIEVDNIRRLVKRFGMKKAIEIAKILFEGTDSDVLSEVLDVIAAIIGNRKKTPQVFESLKPGLRLPEYKTSRSAAADIYAPRRIVIPPSEFRVILTGFKMTGNQPGPALILCRSSLAARGVIISGGLIDEDYEGEVSVIMHNGPQLLVIEEGERFAQIMFTGETIQPDGVEVDDVLRSGGMGSTGR